MRKILAALVAVAMVGFATEASAAIQLTLNRTSDTTATLTGSGSIDQGSGSYVGQLILNGATNTIQSLNLTIGNLALGSQSPFAASTKSSVLTLAIRGRIFDGDSMSGSSSITLADSAIFAAIGTTGMIATTNASNAIVTVGSYEVVPLPQTLPLIAADLAGHAWLRRRQTATA